MEKMAITAETTPHQRIAIVKRHINQKLHGEDNAASLYQNMKRGKTAQV